MKYNIQKQHTKEKLYINTGHQFILLRLNPFDLRFGWEWWWFVHFYVIVDGFLISREC